MTAAARGALARAARAIIITRFARASRNSATPAVAAALLDDLLRSGAGAGPRSD